MKYYAVARGKKIGLFTSWKECQASTKGYKSPIFKSFETRSLAEEYLRDQMAISAGEYITVYKKELEGVWESPMCHLLRFDGGSRGNPGLAGSGSILLSPVGRTGARSTVFEAGRILSGKRTNNEAEYDGIINGLTVALYNKIRHVVIEGDSKLVIEQVRGAWKASAPHIQELLAKVMHLIYQFDYVGIRHIRREGNSDADRLANEAMDKKTTFTRPQVKQVDFFGGLNFII